MVRYTANDWQCNAFETEILMNVLTKEIAEQFLANESSVAISEFTAIEDAAAESLSKHKYSLSLDGLTSLSDAAAESLCGYGGRLNIDLDELPESAADILSKHPSFADED